MSHSVRPQRRQPTSLPRPWDSPGKNTGVRCHFLLHCMKVKHESEVAQSCLTLSNPMDCSLPGSSVHGILQARVLEWVAIAFSEITNYITLKKEKKILVSLLAWIVRLFLWKAIVWDSFSPNQFPECCSLSTDISHKMDFPGSPTACPSGTYKPEGSPGGISTCLPCPDENHTSPPGSTSPEDCVCKEGYQASGQTCKGKDPTAGR